MARTQHDDEVNGKLEALKAALDDYLSLDNGLSPRTLYDYKNSWAKWKTFCTERGFEPLPAPIEAYQAFLGAARNGNWAEDGRTLSVGHVDNVLAAVKHHHQDSGYTPACAKPQHSRAFHDALRGYRRSVTRPIKKAKELDIPTLKKLLTVQPALTDTDRVFQAIVLLSLNHQMPLRMVLAIKPDQVHVQPDDSLFITTGDGIDVTCKCADLKVQQICLACLLADIATRQHPSGRLLCPYPGAQPLCQTLDSVERVVRNQAKAWQGLAWRNSGLALDVQDEEARDRLRRILTHYALIPGALMRARTKMVLSVAFYAGLRAGSDLDQVRRDGIKPIRDGYRLTVRKSKTDQEGKGWDFGITHTKDPALDPVAHLNTWLMIRDQVQGATPDGPLVYPNAKGGRFLTTKVPRSMHRILYGGFNELQEQAGVAGYSLHSLRRGYATEAVKQGVELENIQRTMRHTTIDLTASYVGPAASHEVLEQLSGHL